ncbi:MAG TPA: DUF2721 domain-containing protein [Vicinamibacterales bacterium]|nr:DUF2721 domain-containing protein [Vicinamibacterales bacterium]
MDHARLAELVPVLQVAVGPAILISAVGLLLLTMTNRFGRIIDRSRILASALRSGDEDARKAAAQQVAILWRRARLVRRAIVFGGVSALLAAALIIALFVAALGRIEMSWLIVSLFVGSLATLILSLLVFLQEIEQSLIALKVDLFGSRS